MGQDGFTEKLAKHIVQSSLLAHEELKSASDVAAQAGEGDDKTARRKSIWRKIFLPKEQMKFLFPVLKKRYGYCRCFTSYVG